MENKWGLIFIGGSQKRYEECVSAEMSETSDHDIICEHNDSMGTKSQNWILLFLCHWDQN